jgi:ribose transport system permease protein
MTAGASTVAVRLEETPRRRDPVRIVAPIVLVGAVGAIVLVGALTSDVFLTTDNVKAVARNASITAIVAVCATAITLSGNFFSIALGQTAVFASVVFGIVMRAEAGLLLALLATFAAVIALGTIQGGVVALGANPIVTTLGASALLAGISGLMAGPSAVHLPSSDAIDWIGSGRPAGIPIQTWTCIVVLVVVSLLMGQMRLGRATILTGSNRAAARSAGVPVSTITIAAFVSASIGAGIVGIFQAAQFNRATIDTFTRLDFDVIAAILVGGISVAGGEGSPLRAALGGFFIALVSNYMLLQRWSEGTRIAVLGLVVIIAALTFHLLRRRARLVA